MLNAIIISLLPSVVKKYIYRLKGFNVSKKCKLGFGAIINVEICEIQDYTRVASFSYIKARKLVLEKESKIKSFSYIKAYQVNLGAASIISNFVIIRASHLSESSKINVGKLVHIFPFSVIDCTRGVSIGDYSGIGSFTNIYTHGSYRSILNGYPVDYGDVAIGKNVELTYNVFVAPGVTIHDNSTVAYGAFVNKDVEKDSLCGGLPARTIRNDYLGKELSTEEKNQVLNLIFSALLEELKFKQIDYNQVEYMFDLNTEIGSKKQYIICFSLNEEISVDKKAVFTIGKETCNYKKNDKIIDSIISLYSRYGIRFLRD